jgi:signal transduction histidine kinase
MTLGIVKTFEPADITVLSESRLRDESVTIRRLVYSVAYRYVPLIASLRCSWGQVTVEWGMEEGKARRRAKVSMVILAGVFSILYLGYFVQESRANTVIGLKGYLEVVLLGIPVMVLYTGSAWVSLSDVDGDLLPRVVGWTFGGAVAFVVVVATTMFVIGTQFDPGERFLMAQMSSGFGSSAGLVSGVLEARAIQQGRERARSEAVADRTERERERMAYLNRLLRHEVLNGIAVVQGTAAVLLDDADEGSTEHGHLRTVHRRSGDIARFIQSIRALLQTPGDGSDLGSVDLRPLVEREAERLAESFDAVVVHVEVPPSVSVAGNDLLERVFANLFENAAIHAEGPVRVSVTAEVGESLVEVRVSDDGPGIPEAARGTLFEPPERGDHGFGLYLSRDLVERCGGRLCLERSDDRGSVFALTLRRAETDVTPRASADTIRA